MTTAHRPLPVEYVIPLRWADDRNLPELTQYLRDLHTWVDVTVVDGSDAELFAAHAAAWPMVRHLPVGDWPGRNRKVAGVVTGSGQPGTNASSSLTTTSVTDQNSWRKCCPDWPARTWCGRRTYSSHYLARAMGHRPLAAESGVRFRLPRYLRRP